MELRQLRYLIEIADEGQFTRAAAKLHIAQPALSQQIQRLERELGTSLLDRGPRHVSVTAGGKILVERGRRILAETDAAIGELQELVGLQRGRLEIGASPTLGSFDLSAALAEFHRANPAVELAVREQLSVALCEAVADDAMDLGFVSTPGLGAAKSLEMTQVAEERLVCVVADTHPLARRSTVAMKALRDEAFAMFPSGATIRAQVELAGQINGFMPKVGFETNDLSRMYELVSRGLAVAIVPVSDAHPAREGLRVLDIRDKGMIHRVFMASRAGRSHSPAALRFMELIVGASGSDLRTRLPGRA